MIAVRIVVAALSPLQRARAEWYSDKYLVLYESVTI